MRATDNGTPPRHTDHSLTINILDVNDNPPVIENPKGYNVTISEVGTRLYFDVKGNEYKRMKKVNLKACFTSFHLPESCLENSRM